MEIIDELEPHRRGIYGGCIGYNSDSESEYHECRSRAHGLIRAAEEAVRFAARELKPGEIQVGRVADEGGLQLLLRRRRGRLIVLRLLGFLQSVQ